MSGFGNYDAWKLMSPDDGRDQLEASVARIVGHGYHSYDPFNYEPDYDQYIDECEWLDEELSFYEEHELEP